MVIQINITEKIDFLNNEIRQIRCLEDENGNKNSLIVTGNKGQLKIVSLYEDSKVIKMELNDLKGNLFDVQFKKDTAVVLSEDGIIYLLEDLIIPCRQGDTSLKPHHYCQLKAC